MNSKYVDVFYGCGEIDHPKPQGIAATWYFIKAQCGNTHPHAALPFGKMSAGLYTGAYPTGYGNHEPNSCGPVLKIDPLVRGFSHIHQSGTGGIGAYYNYAVTSPVLGELAPMEDRIKSENAEPGYYSAELMSGIKAEITVEGAVALHRYHIDGDATVSIDFSNVGLGRKLAEHLYGYAKDGIVRRVGENAFSAEVTLQGVRTFFYAECSGCIKSSGLFFDYKYLDGDLLEKSETEERWGGAFAVSGDCEIKLAVSHKSLDAAKQSLDASSDFDTALAAAKAVWADYLGRIDIEADDEIKELFYSNFYHSIIKPSYFEDGKYTDFATLWDMYKTQLPLVYTLYEKESRGIVETLLSEGESYGKVPTALMLWDEPHHFDGQAQLLSVYTMADAYFRNHAKGEDVITLAVRESLGDPAELLKDLAEKEKYTHMLDLTEACGAAYRIAEETGDKAAAATLKKTAEKWPEAFDTTTGLLRESLKYYEGNSHSYSFRLQNEMEKRIALCGKEGFTEIADSFFGYGKEPVKQCDISDGWDYIESLDLRRFDGINNEHDMEAPFVYIEAGRHDRTAEIVRGVQRYMFCRGRGGLPGNNDTGALSSWYVWCALGLFPVSGQDKMYIANPLVSSATVKLANGNTLDIRVTGEGDCVNSAEFNGRPLENFTFTVREMMQGGTLVIKR